MQVRPLDGDPEATARAPGGVPGADVAAPPFLTLIDAPARQDHLPDEWVMAGPVLIAGRTLDRVVVGPNGVFAVTLDPDPRPATLTGDALLRGGRRVITPVKVAQAAAFDLRRVLAAAGIDVFPYPVLVTRGADGLLGRVRVVPPGCLAAEVWRHPGYPLRRSQRARVLAAVQHPATA